MTRRPRADFVRPGDPGLAEVLHWVVTRFPGARGVRAQDGHLVVEQVLTGWVEGGEVRGEARHAAAWPGVLVMTFSVASREVLVERRLRYDEVPPELWGPTVA